MVPFGKLSKISAPIDVLLLWIEFSALMRYAIRVISNSTQSETCTLANPVVLNVTPVCINHHWIVLISHSAL